MGTPIDVNDLLVFARVAQSGSFSRAAKSLGMPNSTVSRRISTLEEQLGIPLLIRTTRSLAITDVGKAYLEHALSISGELEKVQSLATHLQSIPRGTLKITATADFGNRFLGAIVGDFLNANPEVQVDLFLTDRVVDLIEEGFDLAIRIGELDDSTHIAKRIGSMDMQLYASPDFIKARGDAKSCAQIEKFECIRFTAVEDSDHWRLKGPKGEMTVKVSGRVSSNDMAMVRHFAAMGRGIALLPYFFCAEEVRAGKLKPILKDWVYCAGPIHVVYPGQRFLLPRVRAFVDHLTASCSKVKWRYRE